MRVYIDGDAEGQIVNVEDTTVLAEFDSVGVHTVYVKKVNAASVGQRGAVTLNSLTGAEYYSKYIERELKISFYGDSITTGYGVNADGTGDTISNEDGTVAWAQLLADHYGAQSETLAVQGIAVGTTPNWNYAMTDIYRCYSEINRTQWDEANFIPDIVFINLGTNDASALVKGVGTVEQVETGYKTVIAGLKELHPNTVIVCCYGMMGVNTSVEEAMKRAVESCGGEAKGIYSFIFNKVSCGGHGGHPDKMGQQYGAEQIIEFLEENSILASLT